MDTIKLYDYQERVLAAIESDPCHSQLISMPTGTGKTVSIIEKPHPSDKWLAFEFIAE